MTENIESCDECGTSFPVTRSHDGIERVSCPHCGALVKLEHC